jgi:hypothetical protein
MLRRGLAALLLLSMPGPYTGALMAPDPAEERHHCGCTTAICCCHRPSGRADADESKLSCCDGPSETAVPTSAVPVPGLVADRPSATPTSPATPRPAAPASGFPRIETPPPQPRRA